MRFTRQSAGALVLACCAWPSWAQSAGALAVPAKVMESHCVTRVTPSFPESAVASPETVTVHALISRTGLVTPLSMQKGDARLETAAMSAVRSWRYSPYQHGGQPVAVMTDIDVIFTPGVAGGLISHGVR